MSRALFLAAKSMQLARLHREAHQFGSKTASLLNLDNNVRQGTKLRPQQKQSSSIPATQSSSWCSTDAIQTQLLLLCYAAWCDDTKIVHETFMLWNLLGHLLFDVGLTEPHREQYTPNHNDAWMEKMREEVDRRTKLSALSFLTTTSIAYDFNTGIRYFHNELRLPCSQNEWEAQDAAQWDTARRRCTRHQMRFDDALQRLFDHHGPNSPLEPLPTSLGNYLLMHGLLQRIIIVRELNTALERQPAPLPVRDIEKLEYGCPFRDLLLATFVLTSAVQTCSPCLDNCLATYAGKQRRPEL